MHFLNIANQSFARFLKFRIPIYYKENNLKFVFGILLMKSLVGIELYQTFPQNEMQKEKTILELIQERKL